LLKTLGCMEGIDILWRGGTGGDGGGGGGGGGGVRSLKAV